MKANLTLIFAATLLILGSSSAQTPPGTILWTYRSSSSTDWILSSPALAADGTVYIASGGLLCAVTNSGSTASNKWTLPVQPGRTVALGADGTIYCADGNLYAISPDGTLRWTFPGGGTGGCSPAIGSDNTIYFVSGGQLHGVSPSGARKWGPYPVDYPTALPISPIIGEDGTIYVGSRLASTLYAFSPRGTNEWSIDVVQPGDDSLAIGANGAIYYTARSLWAFNADGTKQWSTGNYLFQGTPAVTKEGTIYAPKYHVLYAVSPAGEFIWHALGTIGARVGQTSPAIDAAGKVYFSVSNSVWALNPQGEVLWSVTEPGDPGPGSDFAVTSPIIAPNGTLYAALGPTLYAIATGTNGPADSPWPMSRQNARNTGKVEKPALKSPKKRADANFDLQLFPNQLGLTYTVENSSNLVDWVALTNFVATNSPVEVPDLTATNAPVRFYRAFSNAPP